MPSCVAYNCVNRSEGSGSEISMYSFPRHDKARMCQWVKKINRKNWKPNSNSRICASTFSHIQKTEIICCSDCFCLTLRPHNIQDTGGEYGPEGK
ncbi:hypothetical protein JOQ06_002614 [Pogonophryne albipinna]|uniref:THAP-type domain-containing protein n=1 Tax=Pogonophryne albipinna TaxID=1090488 RepID=A0AAD6B4Q9_9TELE|nr:hypothetical protein JOQ06_002614 [Pogonophryne albipinna]